MASRRFGVVLSLLAFQSVAGTSPDLVAGFRNPPKENRPIVWWWWQAPWQELSHEAITRDLEGMRRVGVTGFHIYGVSPSGADWLDRVKWALKEAARLDLDAWLAIGNAGCGHAETPPEHAFKDVVFTIRDGEGGGTMKLMLPKEGYKDTPRRKDGVPACYRDVSCIAIPDVKGTPISSFRDVTACLNRETDAFVWKDAPRGRWKIMRFGYVPRANGWMGCYIDHMSKAALDDHWARLVTPVLKVLDPAERRVLKGVMCDSWESQRPTWTAGFEKEFARRRGYDPTLGFATLAHCDFGAPAEREAFDLDFKITVGELIAENHYAYQRELARRDGLVSIAEAAGPLQKSGDVRQLQGRSDVAMGEFWMPCRHFPRGVFMVRDAASAAHVYGIREVLAESFTTINTYWTESPAMLKPYADGAFGEGLTRVCYHGMMLSPSLTDKPGRIRQAGIHYNPQMTWFEQSVAFNLYLARCSWMLSQGRFCADVLAYCGNALNFRAFQEKRPSSKEFDESVGPGYDCDFCPTEVMLKAEARDGFLVLPSGMRYRALSVSDRKGMTFPKAGLEKIAALEKAGVTVLRTRETRQAWGCRETPDFGLVGDVSPARVEWVHRSADAGEIYFVANNRAEKLAFDADLRVAAGIPEAWDPVTGAIRPVPFARRAGLTRVSLSLPPNGSVFVVFPKRPSKAEAVREAVRTVPVSGVWSVSFDPAWCAEKSPVAFPELVDWTKRAEEDIRHYSGTAEYRLDVPVPALSRGQRLELVLGQVRDVAEVRANGVNCGILWTPPYRTDVTEAVRKGTMTLSLSIRVTNLWPNRMIGDAALPAERRRTKCNLSPYKAGDRLCPSGLLGPVTLQVTETRGGLKAK